MSSTMGLLATDGRDPGAEEDEVDPEDVWKRGIYAGKAARPAYYHEAPKAIRMVKVIILAAVAIGPYYVVLDQVGMVKRDQFVPCSNSSCTYMRLWPAVNKSLPATGLSFIRVRNGVKRPIALRVFPTLAVYSVDEVEDDEVDEKLVDNNQHSHVAASNVSSGPTVDGLVDETTRRDLLRQQMLIQHNFSNFSRVALMVTKMPLKLLLSPVHFLAQRRKKWHEGSQWGMHNIASGTCPGVTNMAAHCEKPEIIHGIVNHLSEGGSKRFFTVFVILWFTLTCAHDIMLLSGHFNEKVMGPLLVGAAATVCQGLACAALFLWAMGATEVFTAPAGPDADPSSCMCYYELPPLRALLALSTPFALLFSWVARIQLLALSALYGDYLHNSRFIVPHHLAKKTMLWTWSILISPKVTGTVQDITDCWYERIMKVNPKNFNRLYLLMRMMYWLRLVVLFIVSVVAAPFMVRVRELISQLAIETEGSVNILLRFVAQPLPAVLALVMGVWALFSLYRTFIKSDQVRMLCCREAETPNCVRWTVFLVMGSFTIVAAIASLHGLWPSMHRVLHLETAEMPGLALAELWGSCGFALCILTIGVITHEIFCLEGEIHMLRKMGDQLDGLPRTATGDGEAADGGQSGGQLAEHRPMLLSSSSPSWKVTC